MSTSAFRTLYDLAEDQMGFVTMAQAADAGVHPMTMVMMTKRGTLNRASRGVYRLVEFPAHALSQYMQATLWPYSRRGVLSHETALSLYELSDVAPALVHVTVPIGIRIQRVIPTYLVIHHADLPLTDVVALERMPITTPARTISDCIASHSGPAIVRQAIESGRRRGILDAATARRLERELDAATNNSRNHVEETKRRHGERQHRGRA